MMSPEDLAKALEPVWKEGVAAAGYEPTLWLEPGRFFVGGSGYPLTRVNTVKETPLKTFVNVDAGLQHADATRPCTRPTIACGCSGKPRIRSWWTSPGTCAKPATSWPKDGCLPRAQAGDLVVILDAGAYGFSMASEYNARPLPAEVWWRATGPGSSDAAAPIPELFRNAEGSNPAKH